MAFSRIVWQPQRITHPLRAAFRPAVFGVVRTARAIAPGPRARTATKVSFYKIDGGAVLHAPKLGPRIYPIVSGSRSGIRETSGHFVIPGNPIRVVKRIDHPGTRANPWLSRAGATFGAEYNRAARIALARSGRALGLR